jgi:GNAT superfamily N-acetyltransferase
MGIFAGRSPAPLVRLDGHWWHRGEIVAPSAAVEPPAADATTLRDGSKVLIRPITAGDKSGLTAAFERLGERSRQLRFLGHKKRLTGAEVAYFTEVDHTDHEALVGTEAGSGEIVGVARYVRLAPEGECAEAAVVVADDWQRRGLGTALLTHLAERALRQGISRFEGTLLWENRAVIEVFKRLGAVRLTGTRGVASFVVELGQR